MSEKTENINAKCNYKNCYAGVGLKLHGRCFLSGDIENENCPNFMTANVSGIPPEDLKEKINEEKVELLKKQYRELFEYIIIKYIPLSELRDIYRAKFDEIK